MTRQSKSCACCLVLAVAAAALSGCAELEGMLAQRPTASIAGARLADIGLQQSTLLFDVAVKNPYAVPLPLANLDYSLASRGQAFMTGKADLQGTVPAQGTKTLAVPVAVSYLEMLKVLKDIRPGAVVPYAAELGLSVNVPGAGPLRLPLKKEGEMPVPTAPEVQVTELKWDTLGLDKASGHAKLNVVNRNQFPVDLSKFAYGLSLGDVEVANSVIQKPTALAASGGAGTIEIPLSFSPAKAGLGLFRMLTGGEAGYKLKGTADLGTPFGAMSLPVEKLGKALSRR